LRIENGVTRGVFSFNKALRFTLPSIWINFGALSQGTFTFTLITGDTGPFTIGRVDVYVYDASYNQVGSPETFYVDNSSTYNGVRLCVATQSVPQGGYVRLQRPLLSLSSDIFIDAISAAGGPVPVELVSFRSYVKDAVVELKWNTATELNNFGFHVERSIDAEHWESIGFVPGFGTTASPKEYAFTDGSPVRATEVSFYRLKQQDRDGTIEYSDVLRVMRPAVGDLSMRSWPLPFATQLSVEISSAHTRSVSLILYNSVMQKVREIHSGHVDGSMTVTIPTRDLQAGTYFLVLHQTDGPSQVRKLMHLGSQ
jgi:hypothetical protein